MQTFLWLSFMVIATARLAPSRAQIQQLHRLGHESHGPASETINSQGQRKTFQTQSPFNSELKDTIQKSKTDDISITININIDFDSNDRMRNTEELPTTELSSEEVEFSDDGEDGDWVWFEDGDTFL